MEQEMSNVAAIRVFFGEGKHGRKVEMAELKVLSVEDRDELGKLAKEALQKQA